jgi:hypothetical protein
MISTALDPLVGWVAILSAAAGAGTMLTSVLFLSVGERFGRLNDAVSVLQMILGLPLAGALLVLTRPASPWLALVAAAVGAIGMAVAAVLQALLVASKVTFEQTIVPVLRAGAAVGVWLALANGLAISTRALPAGLAILGIAAGVGYVLVAVGFRLGGQQHPLGYAGGALALAGYAVWAFWLGLVFLRV